MVGTSKQSFAADDATYLRKIRKPMIEKKRRERMNTSITQLRALIDDTVKNNIAPMTKVDKADILELTVCHLTKQQQQQRVAIPTTNTSASYASGFQDCAREVVAFLVNNGMLDESGFTHLSRHLHRTFNSRAAQFVPENTNVSTPNRSAGLFPGTPGGTPYQLQKVSPIQPHGDYVNSLPLGGAIPKDRSRDNSFNITANATSVTTPRLPPFVRTSTTGLSPLCYMYTDSSRPSSNSTPSSFEDISSSESFSSSSTDVTKSCHDDGRTVSIGAGSENEIGHVITDSMWRPW